MKTFCFTVDDNIRFLKELTENNYNSIFDHPYLAMYKRLHEEFGLKIQFNLFYRMEGFDLSEMSAEYYSEFEQNADWMKFSFHSDRENIKPYEFSGYDEVYNDCKRVNEQVRRFASPAALAKTTTIHYCLATEEGLKALADNQIVGLLGLFGSDEKPRISYGLSPAEAAEIRKGLTLKTGGFNFAAIDVELNFPRERVMKELESIANRSCVKVMIHEQFYYADYKSYQPDFEDKLREAFAFLKKHQYISCYFEDLIG